MDTEVIDKLFHSDAVRSLELERKIVGVVKSCGWHSVQGCYYQDPDTGKPREIDVFAQRIVRKKTSKEYFLVRANVLFECKSLRRYHLVFSGSLDELNLDLPGAWAIHHWIGSYVYKDDVESAYVRLFGLEKLREFRSVFQEIAYPNEQSVVANLIIAPPVLNDMLTTFRETNISEDRDLEKSVIWKSLSGLVSATEGMKKDRLGYHISRIFPEHAPVSEDAKADSIEEVFDGCYNDARQIDLFHPVIVVEAPMWKLVVGGLRRVGVVRLLQTDFKGVFAWCDVVHVDAMEDYVKDMLAHYDREICRGLGWRRYPRGAVNR